VPEAPPPDKATLNQIFAAWSGLGAYFSTAPAERPVDLEVLIVAAARVGQHDERPFVVAVSWLAVLLVFIDGSRLVEIGSNLGGAPEASAALGAILSWADELSGGHAEVLRVGDRLTFPRQ